VAHAFWLLKTHDLSHKQYVTFEDDKKGKELGTGIKAWRTSSGIICSLSLSWSMLILMFFFTSLVHKFLDLLVPYPGSERSEPKLP
jgi:hypothetical protein